MSATIVSYARFQEMRQRRQPQPMLPGTEPVSAPEGELPVDLPLTIMCEVPAPEPARPDDVTAQQV